MAPVTRSAACRTGPIRQVQRPLSTCSDDGSECSDVTYVPFRHVPHPFCQKKTKKIKNKKRARSDSLQDQIIEWLDRSYEENALALQIKEIENLAAARDASLACDAVQVRNPVSEPVNEPVSEPVNEPVETPRDPEPTSIQAICEPVSEQAEPAVAEPIEADAEPIQADAPAGFPALPSISDDNNYDDGDDDDPYVDVGSSSYPLPSSYPHPDFYQSDIVHTSHRIFKYLNAIQTYPDKSMFSRVTEKMNYRNKCKQTINRAEFQKQILNHITSTELGLYNKIQTTKQLIAKYEACNKFITKRRLKNIKKVQSCIVKLKLRNDNARKCKGQVLDMMTDILEIIENYINVNDRNIGQFKRYECSLIDLADADIDDDNNDVDDSMSVSSYQSSRSSKSSLIFK
ncbi:hypothetical protein [Rachiplusia nu nucleopolyhedrovirus]|uniref:Uncharacterized protein n=1 Tax=Rachiplusia nu nucleopolyhedrovirus TaxID=2605775 RepID=A0AAE6M5N1_9ABAC|nr:hypothetical protein QKQ55_gp006 [Rachiplusia nu nucleopolyhedrovirus]QEI03576.1 hypothetical protein [Rachiplusia nu nucleopolyhedrovirus]